MLKGSDNITLLKAIRRNSPLLVNRAALRWQFEPDRWINLWGNECLLRLIYYWGFVNTWSRRPLIGPQKHTWEDRTKWWKDRTKIERSNQNNTINGITHTINGNLFTLIINTRYFCKINTILIGIVLLINQELRIWVCRYSFYGPGRRFSRVTVRKKDAW